MFTDINNRSAAELLAAAGSSGIMHERYANQILATIISEQATTLKRSIDLSERLAALIEGNR